MNVLFFDDEPFISNALTELLKLYGWNIKLVDDIYSLFMELTENQYDILMLDIMAPVPEMNNLYVNFSLNELDAMDGGANTGIVLAEKIWGEVGDREIPILFLSSRGDAEIRDKIAHFRQIGKTCSYLRKPELAETIHTALQELLKQ